MSGLSAVDLGDKARNIEKVLAALGVADAVRAHEVPAQHGPTSMDGFTSFWGRRARADGRRRFGMRAWW
jgi:hypothetical protein